jgi:hypothetical protein
MAFGFGYSDAVKNGVNPMYVEQRRSCAALLAMRAMVAGLLMLVASICHAAEPEQVASPESKLAREVDHLVASQFVLIGSGTVAAIQKDNNTVIPVQLEGGAVYAFVAVCGENCDHVEIDLYDSNQTHLHRSPQASDVVIVGGQAKESGLHRLSVSVPACRADACAIAFAVLKQGESSGAAQSAGITIPDLQPMPTEPFVEPTSAPPDGSPDPQQIVSSLIELGVTARDFVRAKEGAAPPPTAPRQTESKTAPGRPPGYKDPSSAEKQPQPKQATAGTGQNAAKSGANCEQVRQRYMVAVQQVGPIGSAQPAINLYAYLQCHCGHPPSPHVTSCPPR